MHQLPTTETTSPPVDLATLPDDSYLRKRQVLSFLPFSGETLRRKYREGSFPAPTWIGARTPAWRVGDVRTWLHAQKSARAPR